MSASTSVRISVRRRLARVWCLGCRLLGHVVGPDRGLRWATWGAKRLIRMRVDRGPWRSLLELERDRENP